MKSLKMFAIALLSMLVMTMGVRAEVECMGEAYLNDVCETSLTDALDHAQKGDTVKVLKASSLSVDRDIDKDITLDLNGKTITVANGHSIIIKSDANVTITGTSGIIKNVAGAGVPLIKVEAGSTLKVEGSVELKGNGTTDDDNSAVVLVAGNDNTDLTTAVSFGKDVTVTSTGYGLVLGVNGPVSSRISTAKNTTIDMDGTWTTEGYVIKVNGFIAYDKNAPVINVNAGTYTSNQATALYASGYGIWTINGTVKGAQAVTVRSGKVSITGGTYTATDAQHQKGVHDGESNHAIAVLAMQNDDGTTYNGPKYVDVAISGGEFTAKKANEYAVYIKGVTEDTKLAVSGGKFTSGKGNNGKYLPVMHIEDLDKNFLDQHKNMISGGEFIGGLIGNDIRLGSEKYSDDDFVKALASAEFTTDENGNVVVGNGAQAPDKKPEDQQGSTGDEANTPGTTPEDTNPNVPDVPKTNDNILVYAGLGLVSALTVSFSTKRKENN